VNDRSPSALFPLTTAQRGVWFDQLLHPDEGLYNMCGSLRIDGPVDEELFATALQHLVDRHDALRIVLRQTGEMPMQKFAAGMAAKLECIDFSGAPDPEASAGDWMRRQVEVLFPMLDTPLFQFALLKIAPRRWYWFHKYHHIIIDAYGHSLLVGDLARIYSSLARGETPAAEPCYSYRDFIAEDEQYAESARFAADRGYWREKFHELPEPVIERKKFGDAIRHRRAVLMLPRTFYDRMAAFAASHEASTFHLVLAAIYVYFTRTARRDDLAFGLPTLNRGSASQKRTVGVFTGLTPLWLRLGRELRATELLRAIGRELRQDYRHLRVPLYEINRLAGLHKEGRVQLFDVMVTYQKQSYDVRFDGHPVEQVSMRHGAEQTPLALEISEYNDQLDVRVNINFSLMAWSEREIEAFQRRFVQLLEQIINRPDAVVTELALMTEDERRAELAAGMHRASYPVETTLSALFESQVRRAPEAVAIVTGTEALTYDALNRRANRLAAELRARGLERGDRAAVCLERTPELIAAILAILKCGAAYVPIDLFYPAERRAFMLRDSGAKLVITSAGLMGAAGAVRVDRDADRIARHNDIDRPNSATPGDAAYVIYTSGSTGTPKGTLVSHANVVRLFLSTAELYGFGDSDVWTLFHSVSFDFSVWEIFGALLHGGRLVIVPYWVSRAPDELYRFLSEHRVTVLNQTPSAFQQLMHAEQTCRAPRPLALKWVIFGGEALDPAALRPWFERHGDDAPRLVNMYGITETTVHVTHRALSAADAAEGGSRIGAPLPDLDLHILDERMQPVPRGTAGEVFVGGAGVSLGYLNRPELNAERFLADPFSADPRARLYRSGDLARRLADGDVEYLGRIDDQVKMRGFRVELGEIRAALRAHPAVADACVTTDGAATETRIVAYVVRRDGDATSLPAGELRAFLHRSLPDYMLPAAFVTLRLIPLTINGKVDRHALPAPGRARPAAALYVEPRRNVERAIAAVWQEVLSVDRPGLHDNFFELGGHSILMVRARTKLEEQFGPKLSMAQMFAHPTIASLADLLAQRVSL
jgi:amino acid adenylation domain-containing protein